MRIAQGVDVASRSSRPLWRVEVTCSAVHVIAHGADGQVQLGSVTLNAQTLMARAGEVASWGAALTDDADLLLYGCDVAQTALGQRFVSDLAALTRADVAASSGLTGAAALGGNWILEQTTGVIDAALAISPTEQVQWQGIMALVAGESFANTGSLEGQGGGTGWADSWTGSGTKIQVVGTGLNEPSGQMLVSGGAAQLQLSSPGSTDAVRNLSAAVGADGTTTWISFLVQPNRTGSSVEWAGVKFGSPSATTVFAGFTGNDFTLGVAGSLSPATVSGITPVSGTTYLLVVQINHAAGNDAITLYVNPTPGQTSPTATNTASVNLDLGTFTRVALSGGNGLLSSNTSKLDEIRVGQTYAEVAPNGAPVVATTGTPLSYLENQSATAIDAGLTVSYSTNLTGATVSIIGPNFVSGEDVLAFTNQPGITGSWNAGTGVLTLSGAATVSTIRARWAASLLQAAATARVRRRALLPSWSTTEQP